MQNIRCLNRANCPAQDFRSAPAGKLAQLRTFLRICSSQALGIFLCCSFAHADALYLHNGGVLEGTVTVLANGNYDLVVEPGQSIQVTAEQVLRHEVKEPPIDEFNRRLKEIGPRDRAALIELAAFAEHKRLRRTAMKAYKRILKIDPHHAGARERLGYVLYKNRWSRRKELKSEGFVKFRGSLMRPEDIARIKRQELEAELALLLADASSDNKFLRENALVKLRGLKDVSLYPKLLEYLDADSEMGRAVAIRILGNMPAAKAAEGLYIAFMKEQRSDLEAAALNLLKSAAAKPVAKLASKAFAQLWQLRHKGLAFETAQLQKLRKLLLLARDIRHALIVDALMQWVNDPTHGAAVRDLLQTLFPRRSAALGWKDYWKKNRRELSRSWRR